MDLHTAMHMRVWPESVGFKAMMPWATEFKVLAEETKAAGGDVIVEGLATATGIDFCGDILPPSALVDDLPRYQKNPLYTYCHNAVFPIGTTFEQEITEAGLRYKARIVIDDALPLSATAAALISRGVVRRSSIGYDALEFKFVTTEEGARARWVEKARLHEIAAVPLGMNDATLVQATKSLGLQMGVPEDAEVVEAGAETQALVVPDEEKRATAFADLPLAPEDTPWRWDARTSNAVLGDDDWARYTKAHFWFDPERREAKGGHKLPFARMFDGTLQAVWRGCAAAMAVLMGGRGGVDLPPEEKQSVYNHIVKYYGKFNRKAPEFKGAGMGGFLEAGTELPAFSEITFKAGEPEILEDCRLDESCHYAKSRLEGVGNIVTHRLGDGVLSDAGNGGVLSPGQVADVKAAHEHASATLKALGVGVLSRADFLELCRLTGSTNPMAALRTQATQ